MNLLVFMERNSNKNKLTTEVTENKCVIISKNKEPKTRHAVLKSYFEYFFKNTKKH